MEKTSLDIIHLHRAYDILKKASENNTKIIDLVEKDIPQEAIESLEVFNINYILLEGTDPIRIQLNETTTYIKKLKLIFKIIIDKFNQIKLPYKLLNKQYFDLISIIDIYEITYSLSDFDTVLENFKKNLSSDDYETIIELINRKKVLKDISEPLIAKYCRYRRFKNIDTFNSLISTDIETMKCIITKIDGLLNNEYALIPPIYSNEYTEDFIEGYNFLSAATEEEIKMYSQMVNQKHNKNILENIKIIKWYHKINFKKHKATLSQNIDSINKYLQIEEQIFKEFSENIELFTIYINSFAFLRKVIKEDLFNKIMLNVADETEFYENLKAVNELLEKFVNYTTIMTELENVDKDILSFLDIVYNNSSNLKNMLAITNYLSAINIYNLISEIESLELDMGIDSESINILLTNIKNLNSKIAALNDNKKVVDINFHDISSITQDICDSYEPENALLIKSEKDENKIDKLFEDNKHLLIEDEIIINYRKNLDGQRGKAISKLKLITKKMGIQLRENYQFEGENLDCIVYCNNTCEKFINIALDNKIYTDKDIDTLLMLNEKNIPTEFISTKKILTDTFNESTRLTKIFLKFFEME